MSERDLTPEEELLMWRALHASAIKQYPLDDDALARLGCFGPPDEEERPSEPTPMTAIDWWWTGRNNASDVQWAGHRAGYWPPRGVGIASGLMYRLGWIVGKIAPNYR